LMKLIASPDELRKLSISYVDQELNDKREPRIFNL
jgi:hypothetical protein